MGIRFLCLLSCLVFTTGIGSGNLFAQTKLLETKPVQTTPAPIELSADAVDSPTEQNPEPQQAETTEKKTNPDSLDAKPENQAPVESELKLADKEPTTTVEEPVAKAKRFHSTQLLPVATKMWFSVPDVVALEEQFDRTQYGKLANDPSIKPFVDSLKSQFQDWLDDKNVRLGIKVEEIDQIQTGEICIAGVLQDLDGGQPARGSHGLVLLVDITGNEQKVRDLYKKVNADLVKKRNAVQEKLEINGVSVTKTTVKHPKRLRHSQYSFQAIHNGWLLAADNEEIFRDIIRRVASPEKIRPETTFGAQKRFNSIMEQTELSGNKSQFSWYVDPFGYIQLAQAIAAEEQDVRPHNDDWARILQEQGFDAIQGIGGQAAMAISTKDQEFEILTRTFIFAPRAKLEKNQERIFDLFDFDIPGNGPPVPASWIPTDASAYFSANWNFEKLLNGSGHVYDAFTGENEFDRMINDFKTEPDLQLDIPKLIASFDNQFTVVSTTEKPISPDSERVVIGIKIKGDPDFVFGSIKRAVGRKNGEQIVLAGYQVIEVDTTREPEGDEFDTEFQLPPEFGDDLAGDDEEPVEEEPSFELFEKRYFVVYKGYLLVANDKDYLKKLLSVPPKSLLSEAEDYIQVGSAIDRLTDAKKISFRQFARFDRTLETNYEMLRRNEMAKSQTVLAKILNKIFESDEPQVAEKTREQKLDGSKLPEDYQKSVAPYLGPSGWVLETEADGWRITGCSLKKKQMNEIVQQVGETSTPENSQR